MNGTKEKQEKAIRYYDKISGIYDFISNWYYKKSRRYAIQKLRLEDNQTVLNLPCGTGVNFKYFQSNLENSGLIIGIDLSKGMLDQAKEKIRKHQWTNIELHLANATKIDDKWLEQETGSKGFGGVDCVLCDLGLSGLPEWQSIIDNMVSILKPGGRFVILDWYLENPGLLGEFIKWIGKGEVERPLWQYLQTKVHDFELKKFGVFNGVFVASWIKPTDL